MSNYRYQLGSHVYRFDGLADLMAKASPMRSGDQLAGVAALSSEQRVVAQMLLADLPLKTFLEETLIPYEDDEITRLIIDDHDAVAFADADARVRLFLQVIIGKNIRQIVDLFELLVILRRNTEGGVWQFADPRGWRFDIQPVFLYLHLTYFYF